MAHLSSTTVAGMHWFECQVASLYRLGWDTPPDSQSWMDISGWGQVIRCLETVVRRAIARMAVGWNH